MVTIAAALLAIGYTVFYVAGSNLAHGPGNGVGFTEALGFGSTSTPSSSPSAPAQSRSAAPAGKPKPGTPASKVPTTKAQLQATVNRLASGGKL